MFGSRLKALLDERGIKPRDFARRVGIHEQTLYSLIDRDGNKVDLDALRRVSHELDIPIPILCGEEGDGQLSLRESDMLNKFRALDEHGRRLAELVVDAELSRVSAESEPESAKTKIIPLYATPAAAGYANPALGEDYEDYAVPADSRADFAARISGDSMEPFIEDGSIVLVSRSQPISVGDVGLFFVDGDIKCKQYCEDSFGNVYLFSLNRARADADTTIPASSGITVFCFGRVLLPKRPPLPDV